MKRILLYVGVGLFSFAASLAGLYFAMPLLQPDEVESTRRQIDSLASLRLMTEGSMADGSMTEHSMTDSSGSAIVLRDTLSDAEPLVLLGGTHTAGLDTLNVVPIEEHPSYAALIDSLVQARADHQRLASLEANLRQRIAALEQDLQSAGIAQAEAGEVSAALARLEENELGGILDGLDDRSVRIVYDEASPRNRTKILRSLPPQRAAVIVQRMLANDGSTAKALPAGTSTDLSPSVQ